MSASCEGYACPPEHSVPISEVIVVRHTVEELPPTGGELDGAMVVLAVVLFVFGGLITAANLMKKKAR
ncbi:hypothetical protein [Microbacterium algeriense]|uniref:hypothetical protein n=1 Tax=Microbacterium algeriense TaxID=2615184 RepID=UPI003D72191F